MSHRIFHVARIGAPAFPRFVICDTLGRLWNGSSWDGRPFIYADQRAASSDCFDLQMKEADSKKCRMIVEVPIRFQIFGDVPLDPEQLREWLYRHVDLDIDVSSGGPTPDSIILGSIEWPRFGRSGEAT